MKTQEELKKHKKRQNIIAILILIFGTIFSYILMGPSKDDIKNIPESSQKISASVKTIIISKDNSKIAKLEKSITFAAGESEANVISENSGRIKSVNFEVGDEVFEGQVLASFDQSDSENSQKISFESSRKNYGKLRDSLEKTEELVEENIDLAKRAVEIAEIGKDQASTDSEKDLARQNLKIAKDQKKQAEISADIQVNGLEIQLEQSKLALQQAEIAYSKTFIKAPISGVVNSKKIDSEDYLSLGQAVASIVGNGKAEAKVFLNNNEIKRIKKGDSVEILIDDKNYKGKIISKSEIANIDNGRYEVKIASLENISSVANQTGKIILNLYLSSSENNSFFVSLDAVNMGQNKKEVFIVKDSKAVSRQVEIGKIIGSEIEILSGLEDGDVLITENSRNLQDGQLVKVSNS